MSIIHKFQQHTFNNGFQTHNSILDTVPYNPEVIFIGSFNHGWDWNDADFYYGRGMYMWTILANLFIHNNNFLIDRREPGNNIVPIQDIYSICENAKIVFADIVKGTQHNIQSIQDIKEKLIYVNNGQYVWRSYKDTCLEYMAAQNWLDDNVEEIISYINRSPSIKQVYFTFKSGVWLSGKINQICATIREGVNACSIFTPSGNGFNVNVQAPFNLRPWSLTHCWVWNGIANNIPINKIGYGHLDHDWLIRSGVAIENF